MLKDALKNLTNFKDNRVYLFGFPNRIKVKQNIKMEESAKNLVKAR